MILQGKTVVVSGVGPGLGREVVTIALRDTNDRWTRMAALSSIRDGQQFFHDFVEQARERTDGSTAELMRELGRLLGSAIGSNTPPLLVRRAITHAVPNGSRRWHAKSIRRAIARRRSPPISPTRISARR